MGNILIAGGRGFIGRHLSRALANEGHRVSILSRRSLISLPVNTFQWDPLKGDLPVEALSGTDVIINLTGENIGRGRWTRKRKNAILNSRINSTRLLVKTICNNQLTLKLFINASAIGYYGNRPGEELDESSTAGNGFLSQVCYQWEQALEPLQQVAVPCAILRFGIVFSPDSGILNSLLLPLKWGFDVRFGSGRQYISWIHMDDLVQCFRELINGKLQTGICNCVSPHPVRQYEFNRIAKSVMHKKCIAMAIPEALLRIFIGESSGLLTDDQYILPARLARQGFIFKYPDLLQALNNLLMKE
jgi:uncharacterized protein (TIGR01777 family)